MITYEIQRVNRSKVFVALADGFYDSPEMLESLLVGLRSQPAVHMRTTSFCSLPDTINFLQSCLFGQRYHNSYMEFGQRRYAESVQELLADVARVTVGERA